LWTVGVLAVAVTSLLPESNGFVKACEDLPFTDKALHFSAYAGLAFLAGVAYRGKQLTTALVFLVLMGLALEFGQKMSPGRSTDVADFAANSAGVAVGALAAWAAGRIATA
jgi:VanZ family protein